LEGYLHVVARPRRAKHLHIAVQPVTAEVRARYGGLRSERLQVRMPAEGDEPDITAIERFYERARGQFRAIADGRAQKVRPSRA